MGLFESKPCAQCAEKQAEIDRLWAFITGMRAITMSPPTTSAAKVEIVPGEVVTYPPPRFDGDIFRRNPMTVVEVDRSKE